MPEKNEFPFMDPGKARGFQRLTTSDGFFITCAIDHGDDYRELIDPDIDKVPYERTVESKLRLVEALAASVSSYLLDPEYAAVHSILSGKLPRDTGLMVCVEEEGGYAGTGPRGETKFRKNWDPAKIKRIGADMCKLLWYFRPDGEIRNLQEKVVSDLVRQCSDVSLPLVVEPIWNALEGEDTASEPWLEARADGIVQSAGIASSLGADMLKLEFPGRVGTARQREDSATRCRDISENVDIPWVILSAGVDFTDFRTQVKIACENGASGFVAGRSIWRDAVLDHGDVSSGQGLSLARSRLNDLAAIAREHGRPYLPDIETGTVHHRLEKYWYHTWD